MSGRKKAPKTATPSLFVGFDAFSGSFAAGSIAGGAAAATGTSDGRPAAGPVYSGKDAEIAQVVKRLNKKSSVTKLKSLEDLRGIFHGKPKSALKDVAPVWAYHAPLLCSYPDSKVRRAAVLAFEELVSRSKSLVAEYAGELLPAMLLFAQDGDREVVSTAARI